MSNTKDTTSIKFQVTMTESLTKRTQAFADSLGISRSSAVSVLVSQALQVQDSMNTLGDIMAEVRKQKEQETQPE